MADTNEGAGGPQREPAEASDALRDEIDAEIADHLAAAAARWQREGLTPQEAQRRAGERFGEVAAVRRRLWWIHKGEAVMWRTLGIGLLVVVVAALAVAAYGGWRMQRSMDDRLAQLTDQLDALNRTQRELLKREQPAPVLEITGRAYLGDPTKPAEGATLQICRLPDKADDGILTIRSLTADANGAFRSGPLPPGDYYVLAKLLHDPQVQPDRTYYVQSQPQYLYPGVVKPSPLELDLQLHHGTLVLEASSSVPFFLMQRDAKPDEKGGQAALLLHLRLKPDRLHSIPWTPTRAEPERWPIVGVRTGTTEMGWVASPEEYREERVLAAGSYRLEARIGPQTIERYRARPDGERHDAEIKRLLLSRSFDRSVFAGRGTPGAGDSLAQDIEIREGQTTRVRLEVPTDYQTRIQAMLDTDAFWWWSGNARPQGTVNPDAQAVPLKLTVPEANGR